MFTIQNKEFYCILQCPVIIVLTGIGTDILKNCWFGEKLGILHCLAVTGGTMASVV